MKKIGIFIFTHDLRIHDNRALIEASQFVDELLCLYLLDTRNNELLGESANISKHFETHRSLGNGILESDNFSLQKQQFLRESLIDIENSLKAFNQELLIIASNPKATWMTIKKIAEGINVTHIFKTYQSGSYERNNWDALKNSLPKVQLHEIHTYTLFEPTELSFDIEELPSSFSKFRKTVENMTVSRPLQKVSWLPSKPDLSGLPPELKYEKCTQHKIERTPETQLFGHSPATSIFRGGETQALAHLHTYFHDDEHTASPARTYKLTRNALDDVSASTKFSSWLNHGCLSVRATAHALFDFEKKHIRNDSTYWIYFELLWREYFQWYSAKIENKLFRFNGIKSAKPNTSFYAERFKKWCSGQTPYPIVNACMRQLNDTGYISNRGRQLVASCFVHELQLDWRYGAAYFEKSLIDYDMASNWGNWQYLAGVGADPRGHRKFDLAKQTYIYDPDETFIRKWQGHQSNSSLDSNDIVDWPISPIE